MAKKDLGRAAAVRSASSVERWHEEADVVVVGQGGAGVCAALEAAAAGAEVMVLERAALGGGTSAMAGGQLYLGGGTALQKACGFEDPVEQMLKYLVASCGPQADEEKIRFFCERSAAHYDWVVAQGVPFKESYLGPEVCTDPHTDDGLTWTGSELAYPYSEIAVPAPRGHTVQQEGSNAGLLMMQKLIEASEKAGVRTLNLALVETLVQDEARRVVGLVARVDGEERLVRARKGVVLAAGGFIHNREMVKRHAPELQMVKFRLGCDGDDGRGIRMGMGAGGEAIRMDAAMIAQPFSPPRQLLYGVLVNEQGLRYVNEDAYQSVQGEYAIRRQNGRVFAIVDDATFVRPEVPTELAAVGETYQELETELGMPPGSLVQTMESYNRFAEKGEDPYFHKASEWLRPLATSPFAAFDLSAEKTIYAAFTLGGLHTRPTGEVLTPDGEEVSGLFAAGRNTSGMPAWGYNSGLSLADATFFGRVAGLRAATGEELPV